MKKLIARLVLLLVVVVIVAFFARNLIARKSVELGVQRATGFPFAIESVTIAPGLGRLEAKNLHLMNPPDFEEKTFIQMPLMMVDYEIGSMLGAPHITEMSLHISQLTLVKKANGESNIQKIRGVRDTSEPSGGEDKSPARPFKVDKLKIHVDKVSVKDRTRGIDRTVEVNVDATYENINETTDIVRLIIKSAFGPITLRDANINVDSLNKELDGVVTSAAEKLKGAGQAVESTTKSLYKGFKDRARNAK